jgi:plastocyanin
MSLKKAAPMLAAALAFLAGGVARSAPGKAGGAAHAPTAAEFAELKQKVDQQGELLLRLTQLESEHYEMLIKWIQSNSRHGAAVPVLPRQTTTTPPVSSSTPPAGSEAPPAPETDTPSSAGGRAKLASITGHVDVKGKPWGPIYVYVDNIKEPFVDLSTEIVQKDRAFVPNVLVVQRGTRVSFPNSDPFMHNVFSPSATHPFDLGSYKQGEKAGMVRMVNAGVVEVLCNMHAKMRANVLVVPNRHHAKVGADGSFRLENVPVGARQIVAWTPDAKPMTESVALTPAGASVNFALKVEPAGVPLDKTGNPRSGYRHEE